VESPPEKRSQVALREAERIAHSTPPLVCSV
jgi:hypothetical protein